MSILERRLDLTEEDLGLVRQQAPKIAARLERGTLPPEVRPVTFNFVVERIINGDFIDLNERTRRIIDCRVAMATPLPKLMKEAQVTTRAGVSCIFRKGMELLVSRLPEDIRTYLLEQRVMDIGLAHPHTSVTKAKIGQAAEERWSKEEFKTRVDKSRKRLVKIRKIRAAKKGNWDDSNYQAKMKEVKNSPEHKLKIGQLKKRDWEKPRYKQLMSQIKTDWWQNPENEDDIENIREAMRQKWQDPEFSSRASKGWFKPKKEVPNN